MKTYVDQFDVPLQHCSLHIIAHRWTSLVEQFRHPDNIDVMLDHNIR